MLHPPWMTAAACRGRLDLDFFPDNGKPVSAEVEALCAGCPVSADCSAYVRGFERARWSTSPDAALRFGYWAGRTPRQRMAEEADQLVVADSGPGRPRRDVPLTGTTCYRGHDRWSERADGRIICMECGTRHPSQYKNPCRRGHTRWSLRRKGIDRGLRPVCLPCESLRRGGR